LTAISAAAQNSEPGFGSYTSLDYDEATNTVTAYSETDADYEVMSAYGAYVGLTVTKGAGAIVTSGSSYDSGDGIATVELSFAGEPDTDYRATGQHRAQVFLWGYDDGIPIHSLYYDNFRFTSFESQGVYNPFNYRFASPGYNYFSRRNNTISLGRTFDTLSTQRLNFRGSIQAQGPDINYGNRKVDLGDSVFGNKDTVSRAWAQNFPLGALTGVDYVNAVKSKMTPTQLSNREAAFTRAIDFINRCGRGGGCSSPGLSIPGLNGTRVDVVINAGNNFVPETTARPELGQ
jgi:hypothetical protein